MLDKLIQFFLVSAVLGVAVSYSKLYLFHISLGLLGLYLIANYFNKELIFAKISQTVKLHYMFYIFLFWYMISYFWIFNDGFEYYYKYLFYIINGVVISLVIVYYSNTIDTFQKVYKALAIIFVIEILLSLLELHPDFMLPIAPSSTIVEYFGRSMASNNPTIPTGFNWNQNSFAAVMVLILPFILFLKNILFRVVLLIAILVLVINTGSFGSLFSLIFVLSVYLILYKKMFIGIIIVSFIAFFGFDIYKEYLPDKIKNKIENIDVYTTKFISEKDVSKENMTSAKSKRIGFKAINNSLNEKKQWLIGLGAGQSEYAIKKGKNYHGITSVHNFWYEQLGNGGVLFFTIFFGWYLVLIYKLYKIGKKSEDEKFIYYANSSSLSLIGLFLVSFVPSSMIYMFPLWILFGFSIAVINVYEKSKDA